MHDPLTRLAGPGSRRLAIRDDDGGGWRRLRVPRAGAVTVDFP
jgi:hypothetical protein